MAINSDRHATQRSWNVAAIIPSAAPTGGYTLPTTVHGLFQVSTRASRFQLLADENSGEWNVSDMQLTLVCLPTSYGPVIPTFAGGQEAGKPAAWSDCRRAARGARAPHGAARSRAAAGAGRNSAACATNWKRSKV